MSIGKLINKQLQIFGLKLSKIENNEVPTKFGNRYDLTPEIIDGMNKEARKIVNLLHYTKQNNLTYNASLYDGGYHQIQLEGHTLKGQRVPMKRLELAPYDFSGKVVLDLGCNQGGMLHAIADKIKQGIGIDYDPKMTNAANRIKAYKNNTNLNFYVFNLETENLDILENYLPKKVDVVFLLSVCMWITTWKEVIDKAYRLAENLLFESNGTSEEQKEQLQKLEQTYEKVTLLQDSSPDDPRQKNRKLYFCEKLASN